MRARVCCSRSANVSARVGSALRCPGWLAGQLAPSSSRRRRAIRVLATTEAGTSSTPLVKLKMPYRVAFGETLRLVGSGPILGDWSADKGLQLKWTEGDVWVAEVPMNPGHFEFKCVTFNTQTNAVGRWEDGGNRVLDIGAEPGAWDVSCTWGATAAMSAAFTAAAASPAKAEPVAVAAAAEAPVEAVAEAAQPEELLPAFQVLSGSSSESEDGGDPVAVATANGGPADAALDPAASQEAAEVAVSAGGGVAVVAGLVAAGLLAAVAMLGPGGMTSLSGGKGLVAGVSSRASQLVTSTAAQSAAAGAQVQSQLSSLQAAVAPSLEAASSGAGGRSSL